MNAWEKFVDKTLDKFRLAAGGRGYTCDSCGKEIFYYPRERLCPKCLALLQKSEGEACPKCGRKTCAPGVCLECKAKAPLFTRGISLFVYQGEAAFLLNRLKNGERHLALFFGEKMAEKVRAELQESELPNVVVPVPMSETERKKRGYNQAEALAVAAADCLNFDSDKEVLVKTRETLPQKRLSKRGAGAEFGGRLRDKERSVVQGEAGLARGRYHDDGNDGQRVRETAVRRGSRRSMAFDGCRHARKKVKICFVRKKRLLYRAIKKGSEFISDPFL